jgi:acyl-CoA thioesterase FadM
MGYDFPRVNIDCNFKRVLELDAQFRLRLTAGRLGRTSIRYDYQVIDATGETAIEGTMTLVVLQHGKPTEIPERLRVALEADTHFKEDHGC